MMVKTCSWGTCRSDSRYPERLAGGVRFIPFPRWKKTRPCNREKCLRWIKACNRPHNQLNISRVERSYSYYICTKHFVDGAPSRSYPDPIMATATSSPDEQPPLGNMKPSRLPRTEPPRSSSEQLKRGTRKTLARNDEESAGYTSQTIPDDQQLTGSFGLDMLALASELQRRQIESNKVREDTGEIVSDIDSTISRFGINCMAAGMGR